MRFTKVCLIVNIMLCWSLSQLHAQYLGGNGDGYTFLSSSKVFLDGSTLTARYQGGDGDGYDLLGSLNSFLDGGTLTARYQGGIGDGYDLLGSLNLFLDGSTLTARYQGGDGDGYALLASGSFSLIPGLVFSVERATGNVFAAGSFIPGGADIAERINVSEQVEPGDVVELDPNRPGYYRKARGNSKLIAGVITTNPGFALGNRPEELEAAVMVDTKKGLIPETTGRPLLALMGRVPVKATIENGPIRPGDLLTVSRKPGYAMRCAEAKACEGAIIGKALQGLEGGEGTILVLVMSH